LEGPRDTANRKHPPVSVVIIAMMAVPSGAAGPIAIAKWAALKAEFLTRVLPLPNGIPRKDVFRRVPGLLRPAAFQACFASWLQALRAKAADATEVDRPVFAVDGRRRGAVMTAARGWARCTASACGPVTSGCRWARWLATISRTGSRRSPSRCCLDDHHDQVRIIVPVPSTA
jgi:hypothetical protein